TIIRKLKEMILAFKIEFLFSKNEIITKYLNIIYFGDGSYGIGAAADNYFGKEPSELAPKEVALIIAMAKGPSYSPYNNERLALQRRNFVLSLMHKRNLITKKEYIKAFKAKIDVKPQRRDFFKLAPYFIEEIRKRISEDFGSEVLYGGGLKVYTTLDTDLQKLANKAVEMNLNEISDRNDYKPNSLKDMEDVEKEIEKNMILKGVVKDITENNVVVDLGKGFEGLIKTSKKEWTWGVDPEKHFKKGDDITVKYLWANYDKKIMGVVWEKRPFPQAALVAMNPNNGYVNALIGGSDYRETQFNRAVQSRLQIGSLVKPLYYTAAIDSRRFSMASTYVDSPFIWELPQQNPSSWKPRNYSKEFQGEMTLRNGLAKSINIVSAKLMRDIGPQTAVEYLHKLGI
ncbi:MAG: S1 RNA-binding domain-containing protein, partial [Candidatus Mcinerneyibacterium aminivorans]